MMRLISCTSCDEYIGKNCRKNLGSCHPRYPDLACQTKEVYFHHYTGGEMQGGEWGGMGLWLCYSFSPVQWWGFDGWSPNSFAFLVFSDWIPNRVCLLQQLCSKGVWALGAEVSHPGRKLPLLWKGLQVQGLPMGIGGKGGTDCSLGNILCPVWYLICGPVILLLSSDYIYQYSVLGCPRRCAEYTRITPWEKNVFFCCNTSHCNSLPVKDVLPFNPIAEEV